MRILLLIRSLDIGGTERQVTVLARGLRRRCHEVEVAVLYPGGALEADLAEEAIPVRSLGRRGRFDPFTPLALARELRRFRPQVLYTFLPAANLLAVAARPAQRGLAVVWGIRSADLDLSAYDGWLRLGHRAERAAARLADRIVANSAAARDFALQKGFPAERLRLIRNGIDVTYFRPDPEGRERVRRLWRVSPEQRLVGLVGRLDPAKDHATFLRAAARVAAEEPATVFACIGDGSEERRAALGRLAADLGIPERVLWSPARRDLPAVYSALDLLVSASVSESFPNAVAEAMACGTPCVVTDAGDSSRIVGDLGRVVPRRDPQSLAAALVESLRCPRLPEAALRERIAQRFGAERMIDETEAELRSLGENPAFAGGVP